MNFVIYIFCININLIYSYINIGDYYWEAIKLENGNFLVFSQAGLYILDPTFKQLNFIPEVIMNPNFFTIIKQFTKEDESYILIIIDYKNYILNSNGNLAYRDINNDFRSFNKWTSSVIPFNVLRDVFYYYIITSNSDNKIMFTKYSYNFTKNETLKSEDFYFNNTHGIMDNNYITCQLMKYFNESVISCFFPIQINNETFINCIIFNSEKNFEVIKTSQLKIESFRGPIKSEVMTTDDRQKVLIVFFTSYQESLFYAGYDIYINNFTYGYLINNDNDPFIIYTYSDFFHISYFKETEEFIVSNYIEFYNYYAIYSFDKNFNYYFFGKIDNRILGDSCCNINLNLYLNYYNSAYASQLIFFSSVAQKYCFISYFDSPDKISLFIINKEIKIVNPTELKSSDSPPEFICENYSIYNNTNCSNNLSDINEFKLLSEKNYIEKCTIELDYIRSKFPCDYYTYQTFEFSFNCSEKYPYEIVETHTCVEYCDENSLSSGKCKLNYNYSNNIKLI